jgi:hypothetical protein
MGIAEAAGLAPDTDSGWRITDAVVTITACGGPGPLSVTYKLDGGPEQTFAESATFLVTGVGHHTVVYHATNGLDLPSIPQLTGYVDIETTAPVTTRSNVPTAWRHTPLTVTLTPTDADSGVATTVYTIDALPKTSGTSVTIPAPLDHSWDGTHIVRCHSVDRTGNVEAASSFRVRIDTRKPRTRAPYRASVARYGWAKLRVRIVDTKPCGIFGSPTILVKKSNGKVVFRKAYVHVKVNARVTLTFRCRLARGTYRFLVLAKDAAGNRQSGIGYNRLTVR